MLEDRDWFAAPAAKAEALARLREVAPVELPASYLDLLAFSDGGEGPLPRLPYNLCLDPSAQVVEALQSGQTGADGFLIFGGSGGGEYLALDIRGHQPWRVVAIDMVVGPASAETVAADFDAFLEMVGHSGSGADGAA